MIRIKYVPNIETFISIERITVITAKVKAPINCCNPNISRLLLKYLLTKVYKFERFILKIIPQRKAITQSTQNNLR